MTSVTIRTKPIKNDMLSLYLDYFPPVIIPSTGNLSRREFLKMKIYDAPKDEWQHNHNQSQLNIAEEIRATRFLQVRNREFGLKDNIEINLNFYNFYQSVVDDYYSTGSKANYHTWKASLAYWKAFIGIDIKSRHLSKWHVKEYRTFLLNTDNLRTGKTKLAVNTASSYYKQFIMVLKKGHKEKIFNSNLADEAVYIKEQQTRREYLTEVELDKLWNTPCEIPKVKHMAIFSSLTGLRFSDIHNLDWENVFEDVHQGQYIQFREKKTQTIKNHPISKDALELLKLQGDQNGTIFKGIEYYQVSRVLKKWMDDTDIRKKITFHNFRHTFATLQLSHNENIYTIKELLGHKNVSTTQIYLQVFDRNKVKAVNNIKLKLDGL